MRLRSGALALATCAALSACGSTVVGSSGTVPGVVASADGLGGGAGLVADGSLGDSAEATGAADAPGSVVGGVSGDSTSTPGAGRADVPGPADQPPTSAGAAVAASSATSSGPVKVGFVVYPDLAAFAQAFGGSGESFDQRALVNKAVAAANARGGLAGRKIEPVFYEVELTSAKPYSQSYQEICESFTRDHKTIATVMIGNAENALPMCLARGGSVFVNSGALVHDSTDYRQIPSLISPAEANASRVFPELIEVLAERNAIKRGDKVGLMHFEYPGSKRAALDVVKPLLERRGITVLPYEIQYPQSTPDIANSGAAVQSAVLRYQTEGVSTVMFTCPGCFTFFLQYAENQGYYPRYAVTSLEGLRKDRSAYARALASAIGIGWQPAHDVGTFANPKLLSANPAYQECKAQHKTQIRSEDTEMVALLMCGLVRNLKSAADAVPKGTQLTASSLLTALDRIGPGYAFPTNFTTTFGTARRDASSSYRVMRFDSERRVFAYENTTNRPLP